MAPDEDAALKLRAEDAEDLAVISACLQDALVAVRDLAYAPEERSFLFVANRFRWENGLRPAPGEIPYERVLCGVTFSEVTAVSYSGFRRTDDGRILSLLAIRPEDERRPSRIFRRRGDPARRRANFMPRQGPRRSLADTVAPPPRFG